MIVIVGPVCDKENIDDDDDCDFVFVFLFMSVIVATAIHGDV